VNVGVLGAANIVENSLLDPARNIPTCRIYCVAARDRSKADAFARRHRIDKVHDTYDDVLGDADVDAVYIPLPNSCHYEWAVKALESGKHVLLEKPAVSNGEEAEKLRAVVEQHPELLFAEAYHWRCHPAVRRARERARVLGTKTNMTVRMRIPAAYLPGSLETDIRFQRNLAGGALMDLCYVVDAMHFFLDDPDATLEDVLRADPVLHPGGDKEIDIAMEAQMAFSTGCKADLDASFLPVLIPDLDVEVVAADGIMVLNNFVLPHMYHSVEVTREGSRKSQTDRHLLDGESTYTYQLREFSERILQGEEYAGPRCLGTIEETVRNMHVIDRIYEAAGMSVRMKYKDEEKS